MKAIIAGLLAAAVLLPACGGKENKAKETEFLTIRKEASFKLTVPEDIAQGRPYYSTSKVDLTIPADSVSEISRLILSTAFPDDSISQGISAAADRFLSTPVDFVQTGAEKVGFVPDKPEDIVLLSKNIVIDTLCHNNLTTFHIVSQGYTGGAHGYYSAAYINYDTERGTVVNAENLFADKNGVRHLILESIARKNNCKIEDLEKNGVVFSTDDVNVPKNFYPEADSLVFYYNPYEISSWAQGEVKVPVSATSLAMYATDYGKNFLKGMK